MPAPPAAGPGIGAGVGAPVRRIAPMSARDDFAALVGPHWADMARLARRLAPPADWEDALQEALAAAWRKRAQFDPARGTPRVWLLAIVADQAAKGRRRVRPVEQLVDVPLDATGDGTVDLDLRRAVDALAPRQRVAVVLHYYLGLPVAETAAVMSCSPGTVKSTLSDARSRLRAQLGEGYPS